MIDLTPDEINRFWKRIEQGDPTECWLWTGAVNNNGYGRFEVSRSGARKRIFAHRLAHFLRFGKPLTGMVLMHSCDVPRCCNPGHLRPGTQADNVQDARTKGRAVNPPLHAGAAHHSAKLAAVDVAEIRRRYAAGGITQEALGQEYGVTQSHIGNIVRGDSWTAA